MINLFGMTKKELTEAAVSLGEKPFRGAQLFEWLYDKRAEDIDAMTNLSKAFREKLKTSYAIDRGEVVLTQRDPVDGTRKFLIRFADGECVESVLMRYEHGLSLCVSSQVGCAMGCAFCASTRGGLIRDLTAGEMLSQIALAEKAVGERVASVVVMGIGEPLMNMDHLFTFLRLAGEGWGIGMRHFTVSTCGLVPEIDRLAEENLQINLAVSLHSPFQETRETLMPVARRYPLEELLKSCKNYFTKTGRRITFEYALMAGVNDRPEDIERLSALFKGRGAHINLINLNPVAESSLKHSENVNFFCHALKKRGIHCTMRRTIGQNIDAACGQLRQKQLARSSSNHQNIESKPMSLESEKS